MKWLGKLFFGAVLGTILSAPVAADGTAPWEFRFTPLLWAPTLYSDTTIGSDPPTTTETSLLETLDFGFMATFEARKGAWGAFGEFNYLALSQDASFPGGRLGAKAKVSGFMLAGAVAYRLYEDPHASFDAFAGARFWSLDAEINFRRLRQVSRSTQLFDPIIGVRGEYALTETWFVGGLASIGGFGVGTDLQWELVGRVGYKVNDNVAVAAGWRHLALDLKDNALILDAAMTGPFVAVDFKF